MPQQNYLCLVANFSAINKIQSKAKWSMLLAFAVGIFNILKWCYVMVYSCASEIWHMHESLRYLIWSMPMLQWMWCEYVVYGITGVFTDHAGNSCPQGCYGRGDCVDGQCHCFTGFTGWDCKHSQYSASVLYLIHRLIDSKNKPPS